LYSLLLGKIGKPTNVEVRASRDSGSRTLQVVPIDNELRLRRDAWINERREYVMRRTEGAVGYLHQSDTSRLGAAQFIRYFFPQVDRQAIIVDERFNDGGLDPDYQLDVLARPQRYWYRPRQYAAVKNPRLAIQGTKVMLINGYAGSGGDIYAYSFRADGLGPLVGTRTWGGVNGTYGRAPPSTMVDGGSIVVPNLGVYAPDQSVIVENVGVEPDIEIENSPKDDAMGRDVQLDRAIELALRRREQSTH
jgi:tricorn protease